MMRNFGGYFKRLNRRKIDAGTFSLVEAQLVGPPRHVPEHIIKPHYYESGDVVHGPYEPEIKSNKQIDGMIDSCHLASTILKEAANVIKVGITTDEIDSFVHELCISKGAYPSPLNYKNFPKSICTSVNNVGCHGIPDSRPLEDGDIINVDITVFFNNFHGDCSRTFLVGNVSEQGKELVAASEDCLNTGIAVCGPNVPFKEIGFAINSHAKKLGFTVIPAFLGHGIGSYFHGPPDIYHTRNTYPGRMLPGMTFTVEPAITNGEEMIELLEDGWTAVSADGSRSAQTEHTILITEDGHRILTI